MNWIQRNLIFVVGSLVAALLMGGAGYYTYTRWQANSQASAELGQAYEELKRLNNQNPHPGDGKKVDNIKLARQQTEEVRTFLTNAFKRFIPIPAIPHAETNLTRAEFGSALRLTVAQLQRDATNQSVVLPANYNFSFEAQRQKAFEIGNLSALAVQLGEVKVICDILNAAKINALVSLRRERVSTEDNTGPMSDYLDIGTETNELALLTPYEVSFQSFSAELAAVVSGLANSPHAILVKGINVRPAAAGALLDPSLAASSFVQPTYQPMPTPQPMSPGRPVGEMSSSDLMRQRYGIGGGGADAFRQRYGIGPGGGKDSAMSRYQQTYTPPPVAPVAPPTAGPPRGGLQPMLDERQLDVTITLRIVKLLPAK
jgi:hypothetical protein